MACADPAVFSDQGAGQTFYVYCTGMSHVWVSSDWVHFTDQGSSVQFDVSAMSANGKQKGAWWAPGIFYAPGLAKYVMWVSVPDAQAVNTTADGWDRRSLAVLTSDAPLGPWTFQRIALAANQTGEHHIDPFLFKGPTGTHYVFWKQYGGSLHSRIMGAEVNSQWDTLVASTSVEIINGYGGTNAWELNVRENPALWYDSNTGHVHLLFSGGHWADDTYGTGHAVSQCGPLCLSANGWTLTSSGNRNVEQVMQSNGDADFTSGGPGGAVFVDSSGTDIVYAAAAQSASSDSHRYLMRSRLTWHNDAPYVDTPHHLPEGF